MKNWFNMESREVIKAFNSNPEKGLTLNEVQKRLAKNGHNQLTSSKKLSPVQIFITQFTDFMVLVLTGAAIVSGLLGEKADAITIIAIIVLNAILGFIQEYRAEKSLEALKELTAPLAHVLRESKIQKIPAKELVPGDILILEGGDRIPADGRILEAVSLEINEATLTGESLAVTKNEHVVNNLNPVLGDQWNMTFAGTLVTGGRGKAIITATGMQTEIGKIAGMIHNSFDEKTPLQKRLTQLGRWLIVICLGICASVAALGILRGEPPRQMFLAAVSLAVAAIPEGLPAIVTIALAIGVQKMIKRKAIIRKLPAVETLGCATVICSDKTGTLTQNKLAVTRLWTKSKEYDLTLESESISNQQSRAQLPENLLSLFEVGILCNNSQIEMDLKEKEKIIIGDPTEGAILIAAVDFGLSIDVFLKGRVRIKENPFSSERKRMGVWVVKPDGKTYLMVKGAPDIVLERCSRIVAKEGIFPLSHSLQTEIRNKIEHWGADALRVLAFAYKEEKVTPSNKDLKDDPETDLIFIGLMGMTDPPRPESKIAIERSRRAGIKIKMITGDYPLTAASIARQISLLRPEGKIISGNEIDQLSDKELANIISDIDVFARVSPVHKLRVVKALKKKGEIIAMTGDGVNDAPAVKEADIGVAMGLSGTDVTKEASAMVIADDNFATIVAAIEEGRTIYENIRKFIRYLLSCNTGEILTIFGGIMCGMPFPLLPIQILWVNLVTDGLPAIALGMEPAEPGTMTRKPRPPWEGIFSRGLGLKIIFQGVVIGTITLGIFLLKLKLTGSIIEARTAAFATLVFAQLFFVFQCRSERRTMFQNNLMSNKYLLGAVLISSIMQIVVMVVPLFQKIFYTTNLRISDWLLILFSTAASVVCSDYIYQSRTIIKKHLSVFRFEAHRSGGVVGK